MFVTFEAHILAIMYQIFGLKVRTLLINARKSQKKIKIYSVSVLFFFNIKNRPIQFLFVLLLKRTDAD